MNRSLAGQRGRDRHVTLAAIRFLAQRDWNQTHRRDGTAGPRITPRSIAYRTGRPERALPAILHALERRDEIVWLREGWAIHPPSGPGEFVCDESYVIPADLFDQWSQKLAGAGRRAKTSKSS